MDKKVLRTAFIGERFFSFFIDYIIVFFIVGILSILLIQLNEELIFIPLIFGVVFFILKDIFHGQSIGKRIFQLEIRDEIDIRKKVGIKKLILRNITIFLGIIDFIFMLFSKNNQRLGDRLVGTTVVKLTCDKKHNEEEIIEKYEKNSTSEKVSIKSFSKLITIIIVAFVLFVGGIIFAVMSFIKNSGAYKQAVYQIENSQQVIEQTGNIEGYGFFPQGSISVENGLGTAELTIKVKGNKNDIHVFLELYKSRETEWTVKSFEILE